MKRQLILFAIAITLAIVILVAPSCLVRYCSVFILLWLLPGLSWATLIPRQALDRIEWLSVACGLNFVISPLLPLLILYFHGPVSRNLLLAAAVGAVGLPGFWSALIHLRWKRIPALDRQEAKPDLEKPAARQHCRSLWQKGWIWLLIAVVIAVSLRTVNLNYAEFEGDEAKILLRGARVLEGDIDILFRHKKGPSQITSVVAGWRLTGMTNEWMTRLPFSWASILGVIGVFLVGRRLGRPHAGGIAACLLAIEGYLVGLGRGPKYHSFVFALSVLGLLCLLIYYTQRHDSLVIVSAILFAGGLLSHYDAALALPAGLLLIGARLWQERRRIWRALLPVALSALIGAILIGLFFVPFLRSSHVEYATSYVSTRVGERFHNNLWPTFELSAVYNSVYFLAMMALLLAGQTLNTWAGWGRTGLALSGGLLAAAATGLIWPELWVFEGSTLAWIFSLLLLLGALLSPDQPATVRAVWLWLGVPALFYLFFVAIPLTHVYTLFPAWAMLVGIGLDNLGRWLVNRSRFTLYVVSAGGAAFYALCGFYPVMLFVDYTPEYLHTFPQAKSPIYWTPYEEMPKVGLYGFPYRVGWKAIGYLMENGELTSSYDSNKKARATSYYTLQAPRLDCASPDMYIIAPDVLDETPLRWDQIQAEYSPTARVTVRGQPRLTVYTRGASAGPPETFRVEDYEHLFDLGMTPERLAQPAPPDIDPERLREYTSQEAIIGGFAHLQGYKVDTAHAAPGGYVELTLLWKVLDLAPIDYQVFTHLYDGAVMHGQSDGQPVCGNLPTSQWRKGQLIVDPYRIPIKNDAQPGSVPLTIGMYNLATMHRQTVSLPDGSPAGDSVHLTDITIQSP